MRNFKKKIAFWRGSKQVLGVSRQEQRNRWPWPSPSPMCCLRDGVRPDQEKASPLGLLRPAIIQGPGQAEQRRPLSASHHPRLIQTNHFICTASHYDGQQDTGMWEEVLKIICWSYILSHRKNQNNSRTIYAILLVRTCQKIEHATLLASIRWWLTDRHIQYTYTMHACSRSMKGVAWRPVG